MANLTQPDLAARGKEARLRALIEDLLDELVEYHTGVYQHPRYPLALAVWFGKSPEATENFLLELFSGLATDKFAEPPVRVSLHWKTGSNEPPFVTIHATSVDHFTHELNSNPQALARFFDRADVLYFDKKLLNESILQAFNVITEPAGLARGWYISPEEYTKSAAVRSLLASHGHTRPEIGLVKMEESPDFENCRGLLHAEVNQRWLPLSVGGVTNYVFYNDWLAGRRGYFLLEGGSVYQIQKFEVKTAPEYSTRVLEKSRDDRYPEVYLRAVHPSERPAA